LKLFSILALKNVIQDWMFNCKGIIIEDDNYNIIKFLQDTLKNTKPFKDDQGMKDLWFLEKFRHVIFTCNVISFNKLADLCASLALSYNFLWEDISSNNIPSFLRLLNEDCHFLFSFFFY